eukprot:CAMPEP_0181057650 /NCGR_PEP_ID=MMETSP1070-20121207/20365_1 /TAXON_ID=265543 /ORGANISM="Minutocellus polymorphus, Strain NH13" /LENGTH=850 /DNA_ID=CAMNT_0023137081 /DNA_START=348 /DNA_END=2900 /DNA_ORIENTATION=-
MMHGILSEERAAPQSTLAGSSGQMMATEAAIDAYASRVLSNRSPPEACVEPSLAPYITSLLRASSFISSGAGPSESSFPSEADYANLAADIDEYDSLMELLQEHCGMDVEGAQSALRSIVAAVKTGTVDPFGEDLVIGSFGGVGPGGPASLAGSLNALGGTGSSGVSSLAGSLNAIGGIGGPAGGFANSFTGGGGGGGGGGGFGGRGYRSGSIDDSDALVSDLGQMLKDGTVGLGGGATGLTNASRSTSDQFLSPTDEEEDLAGASSFALDEDLPGFSSGAGVGGSHSPVPLGSAALAAPVGATPLKEDNLLPQDLLGELDEPPTPSASGDSNESKPSREEKKEEAASVTVAEFAAAKMSKTADAAPPAPASGFDFPSITESSAPTKSRDGLPPKKGGGKGGKKKKKKQDLDLAASLFSTSRSRSNSVPMEKSPMLKPMVSPDTMAPPLAPPGPAMGPSFGSMAGPGTGSAMMAGAMGGGGPPDARVNQQVQSTAEILLTMNHSLGEHAAYEAAMVSNADINVAQYVIDGAMGASPVCRHLLNGGCYRSDCQFSHDVDGHTCLFWLRGRCNKFEECQFLHGFCAKLLEGINQELLSGAATRTSMAGRYGGHYGQGPIQTGNLIQRNAAAPYGQGMPGGMGTYSSSPFSSPNLKPAAPGRQGSDFASFSLSGGESSAPAPSSYAPAPSSGPGVSFANIATSGYSNKSSFAEPEGISRGGVASLTQYAKIPQGLWLGSERRDSSVFHITDPMERFAEVAKNNTREDVLDLHFQSIKTFSVVLSTVLDEMLETCDVWVVTGSGHHVDNSSHQKRGGVLEEAVTSWLDSHGYVYARGRDRNGHGGAVLVKRQQQ